MAKKIIHLFYTRNIASESRLLKFAYYTYLLNKNIKQYLIAFSFKKNNCDYIDFLNILPGDFTKLLPYSINYLIRSILHILKIKPNYICIHNPELLVLIPIIKTLSIFFKTKIIYEPHELEVCKNGIKDSRLMKTICFLLEMIFIPFCNLVVLVTTSIEKWYQHVYKTNKTFVLPNIPYRKYFERSNFYNKKNISNIRDSLKISEDKIIFLYQGLLCRSRGLLFLIDIFKQYENKNVVFALMGCGEDELLIKQIADKNPNIFFHDFVDPRKLIDFSSTADFGMSFVPQKLKPCLSYDYSLSNKFYEYLMSGLKVIVSSNFEEQSKLIIKHGLGLVCEGNEIKLMKLIDSIIEDKNSEKELSKDAVRWINNQDYENYCDNYVKEIGL